MWARVEKVHQAVEDGGIAAKALLARYGKAQLFRSAKAASAKCAPAITGRNATVRERGYRTPEFLARRRLSTEARGDSASSLNVPQKKITANPVAHTAGK